MTQDDQLASRLHRTAGDLVRSDDWNALVNQVAALVPGPSTRYAVPGDDLTEKVESLPAKGGQLALAAGTFELAAPLTIRNCSRVTIVGAGPATVVRCAGSESAVVLSDCHDVEISGLRLEGGIAADLDSARHRNGTLTLIGSTRVTVLDCILACAAGPERSRSCLTAGPATPPGDGTPFELRVERCRLEAGARQIGMLVVDPELLTACGNRIVLGGTVDETHYVAQGIVVGGARVGTVRMVDNVIEDVVQGIHVGTSQHRPPTAPLVSATAVLLRGNVIRAFVPAEYRRERHAVFVGNTRSVHVLETTASLSRGTVSPTATPTRVEAVRLYGQFGPFLVVRDNSLDGFPVGVLVHTVGAIPPSAAWLVADTFAEGATFAVAAPDSVVQDRNFPAPAAPPPGQPAGLTLTPAVAVTGPNPQTVLAIVKDAAGQPVPGVRVRFAVARSDGTPPVEQVSLLPTGPTGQTTLLYDATIDASGADTLQAYVDLDGNGVRSAGDPFCSAARVHVATLSRFTLTPASANVTKDGALTLTAVALDARGEPLRDIDVDFAATVGDAQFTDSAGQVSASGTTGSDGQVRRSARFGSAGRVIVTATGSADGGASLRATAVVLVVPPAPPRITLEPASQTVTTGGRPCVTAHVVDAAGTPVPGQPVHFTVTGANRTGSETPTGTDGSVRLCYSASAQGSDRVTATFVGTAEPGHFPTAVATVSVIAPHPGRVAVPNVIGLTLAAARTTLTGAGLVVGKVTVALEPARTAQLAKRQRIGQRVVRQDPVKDYLAVVGGPVDLELKDLSISKPTLPSNGLPK